ncbi:MAG: MFS transporter [Spirochaetes bacterium GWD1_61_31]|nr:MAG: MFS transporter [Spirochaetes bacterium GWB1_60_80]OHD35329.1 MAG: MFS transporter [Spirochaetes bacterium GWC1_61_12]OHD43673.1 MAG: MFS transporter [Spirochaetes bacterium GWD1_61_31]OHD44985.1 MAG: MFS transporter [Spirochaetes bacterium GWE1_60_18]OHD60094.1 MAG: MFS transporter [Spirochaetes bacterium GWF1_60_12]HAP43664.1 MFS transporter [Spirochaetaceae bacterium]
MADQKFEKNLQYYKFCAYGFLKDLRFYEPFLLLFFLEKGLTFLQIGGLYAAREILINLMEIPSGLVADVLGRRRTMVASFLAYIVSFLLFYFSQTWWLLLLAMLCYAFGDAFRTGTHKAMIFDYLKSRGWQRLKTHYYGHTRAWSQRGAAVSAMIAAALVFWRGSYAPVFLFTIIPYVLDLLLILSYPAALDGRREGRAPHLADEFTAVFRSLLTSLRQPATLRAIANQALYTGYYKACKDYLQPMLKALALGLPFLLAMSGQERTAILSGLVYSALYFLTAGAARLSGRFADHFPSLARPLNLTLFTGIGLGLLSGVAYWLGLSLPAIILYAGIYLIENLRKPMGIAYVSERMNQDSLAAALSVESQAETLFAAGLALLLGLFSQLFGPGRGLLLLSGVVGLLAILLRLPQDNKESIELTARPGSPV